MTLWMVLASRMLHLMQHNSTKENISSGWLLDKPL